MYRLRFLESVTRDLAALDKSVARRIVSRLNWLAENLDFSKQDALKGGFSELCKFRVGDYRILYQVIRDENTILIHAIGHRREIYRKR